VHREHRFGGTFGGTKFGGLFYEAGNEPHLPEEKVIITMEEIAIFFVITYRPRNLSVPG
jgi:hypothetical protein